MAIKLADTARPNNYVDAEHLGTYPVAYAEDVWFEDGTRLSEKTFDGQSIQKEELPLASADELGNIYQYVGETGTYTNGRFYKCTLDSSAYSWSEIKMVENPVVYSETVPDINAYEAGSIVCYTGEDAIDFKNGHFYKKSNDADIENKCGMAIFQDTTYYFSENGTILTDVENPYNKTNAEIIGAGEDEWSYTLGLYNGDAEQMVRVVEESPNGNWYCGELILDLATGEITEGERLGDGFPDESAYDAWTVNYISKGIGWVDITAATESDNEFIGTADEWNALTVQEKEKYDGKIVNIVEDGKASTQEVEELTNYSLTEQALAVFSDIAQRFHVYKYGQLIQVSCDNIHIANRALLGDYFTIADGLPAPVHTTNFTYPTYPDESTGKSSIATGYVGAGGNIALRHVGMISDAATYLQGFTVVYLTREV